jgi:methyl-accepting chemotaxis protein
MVKWTSSLNTKLVASFVLIMVITSSLSFFYTYGEARSQLNESARQKLMEVAGAMSTQISGDALMSLTPGQENSSTYTSLVDQMRNMRSNSPDIVNMYTMKISGDNVSFIVDDLEEDPALIGQEYTQPELAQLKEALTTPSASPTFYSDEFGTYMSGYAPIKDSNGTTVAILGVDVTAVTTLQQMDNVRNSTAMIIVVSVVIGTIIILLFSLTLIRDIKKMNVAAEKISTGDMSAHIDIKRKDEVGELADSFGRMIASLKIEMMMRDEEELARKEAEAAKDQKK